MPARPNPARRKPPEVAGLGPRQAALALLRAVTEDGRLLSDLLAEADGPLTGLDPADRARAQRLCLSVLRHRARADKVCAPYLQRPPPLAVRQVLRLAATEICLDRAAPHGVVNAAVAMVRGRRKTAALAGMTNAVLRRVAETGPALWAALPPPRLPKWLRAPLVTAYGPDIVAAMESAHARVPPLDLTLRDPSEAQTWSDRLDAERLPGGSLRLTGSRQVSALPGYAEGAWWVQDAAAAAPARVVGAGPGLRVLDLCAAPGGKTLQLAATGAEVTALDSSADRLARVRENLARTGLAATVVCADALDWSPPEAGFDAILLDAPCSATGTLRRHPDLPYAKAGVDLAPLLKVQAALVDRAVGWLRPGGLLVLCTCSVLPAEGEDLARAACDRHTGLAPDPAAMDRVGLGVGVPGSHGLRLRPDFWADRGGMDGFFIAALRLAT